MAVFKIKKEDGNMEKKKETHPYEGNARELLKIADAIYDEGIAEGITEGVKMIAEIKKETPGHELARACEYKGADIAAAFCKALTDANFHKERKALAPGINRLFGTNIPKEG